MNEEQPISSDDYRVIADNVPIVSVDLLVHTQGGLLLGKRQNEPARGEWFVPGGTVLKGEDRRQAVHRVAQEEMGTDVTIERTLGVYEHSYDAAESDGVHSKQYLATAFVVTPKSRDFTPDEQHVEFRVFDATFPALHDYVWRYINDLRALGYNYS
ncbi:MULTISPECIES: NUDIX domain-containing protein [Haloarcula]|uniref:NUDIX domain-containing protein n=1 Tax=Haloarcula TaxID=2237 RepID=UPI0023ED73B6|nr:NUDIX domain-containing protein [Halomicroarcula sp. XH51]